MSSKSIYKKQHQELKINSNIKYNKYLRGLSNHISALDKSGCIGTELSKTNYLPLGWPARWPKYARVLRIITILIFFKKQVNLFAFGKAVDSLQSVTAGKQLLEIGQTVYTLQHLSSRTLHAHM